MRPRPGALAAAVLAVAIAGCGVTVERPGGEVEHMSVEEFRAYAERVFRRQNAVQDRLIYRLMALRDQRPEAYDRLATAESAMMDACSALVDVVAQRRRGMELGFFQRVALANEVESCEQAVVRVERLLGELGDG